MALDMKGLFVNPAQIRAKRMEDLMQQRNQLSQLGGSMSGLLGQVAGGGSVLGQQLAEGIGRGLGLKTQEERQAEAQQKAFKGIRVGNLESMRAARQRMEEAGASPVALMQIDEMITTEQARQDALEIQRRQVTVSEDRQALDQAIFDADQDMLNEVRAAIGDNIDLNNAEDRANAARELFLLGGRENMASAMTLLQLNKGDTTEKTTTEKNIRFYADMLKCNLEDRECFEASRAAMVEDKRTTPKEDIAERRFVKLEESQENAAKANNNTRIIRETLNKLNQEGGVNIGTFGPGRQAIERFLIETGIADDRDDSVARTTAILKNLQRLSGELLGSGIFGAGTGLSDKDRERAEELFAASGTLTPAETRELLDMHYRYERAKAVRHNNKVMNEARYSDQFFDTAGLQRSEMLVDVPAPYIGTADEGFETYNGGTAFYNPYTNTTYDSVTGEKLMEGKP